MEFIVHVHEVEEHFHGESRYTIENGVLIVYTDDGKRIIYSPSHWQRIVDDAPGGPFVFGV